MIEYIRGQVADLTPTMAVIECNGVGYGIQISLTTFAALQGRKEGKLWIFESIREDAYQLFGFATRDERELFTRLTSVSGIGGQTARMVLSAFAPTELVNIIAEENVRLLKSVKGIGPKAASRIIIELKDNITNMGDAFAANNGSSGVTPRNAVMDEAEQALTILGFAPAAVRKVVTALTEEQPQATAQQLIKAALKAL